MPRKTNDSPTMSAVSSSLSPTNHKQPHRFDFFSKMTDEDWHRIHNICWSKAIAKAEQAERDNLFKTTNKNNRELKL